MVLVAIDKHLDSALDATGFLHVFCEFLLEIRVRIAQHFGVVRILRESLRIYALFRNQPYEPRILALPVTDER